MSAQLVSPRRVLLVEAPEQSVFVDPESGRLEIARHYGSFREPVSLRRPDQDRQVSRAKLNVFVAGYAGDGQVTRRRAHHQICRFGYFDPNADIAVRPAVNPQITGRETDSDAVVSG